MLNIHTAMEAIIAEGGRNSVWFAAKSAEQTPDNPSVIRNVGKTKIKIEVRYILQYLNDLRCGVATSPWFDIIYSYEMFDI